MDAFVFRLLATELASFAHGARVEKIHSPAAGIFTFTIFQAGRKQQLVWRSARNAGGFFLTQHKLPNPERPITEVMRLRKYLAGRRLGGAVNVWPERTLYFNLPASASINHQLWLKLSLLDGPSLTTEPPVLPSVSLPDPAELPGLFPLEKGDKAVWRAYPLLTPALRKALESSPTEDQAALLADLQYEISEDKGCLYVCNTGMGTPKLSPWAPSPMQTSTNATAECTEITLEESFEAIQRGACPMLEAAQQAFEPLVIQTLSTSFGREALVEANRATKKRTRLLHKLDQERTRLEGMIALQVSARAIQRYLWAIDPAQKLTELTIPAEYSEDGSPLSISLDPRKTITENMERMFHEASRGKRGLAMLAGRVRDIENATEISHAAQSNERSQSMAMPNTGKLSDKKTKRLQQQMRLIQRFTSADGAFSIWRGRSAEGNQALLQAASPQDIWMHVKDGPSAHVLIKRISTAEIVPEEVMLEAAAYCLNKSWRKEEAKAEVIYTLAKDVKSIKGGKTGSVLLNKTLGAVVTAPNFELEEQKPNTPA